MTLLIGNRIYDATRRSIGGEITAVTESQYIVRSESGRKAWIRHDNARHGHADKLRAANAANRRKHRYSRGIVRLAKAVGLSPAQCAIVRRGA